MDRDYAIDNIGVSGFYGNLLPKDELLQVLDKFRVPVYNEDGSLRSAYQIMNDVSRLMSRVYWPTDSRQIGDALQTLSYSINSENGIDFSEEVEVSAELDIFLGTFKIQQGGVSHR